ncbi:hypothetical protein CH368_06060 [Leptospira levettii]|nr:hypothetical protein CH368_06060 [Leptospira levettii]
MQNEIYLCEYKDNRNWQKPNVTYQVRLGHPLDEKNRRKRIADEENNISRLIRFTKLSVEDLPWELNPTKIYDSEFCDTKEKNRDHNTEE